NLGYKRQMERSVMQSDFDSVVIPHGGYSTIVVDPPWQYGKWGKASVAPRGSSYEPQDSVMPYKTMTLDEIKALEIATLAADNCDLYLWTTQKYLPAAFEVLQAWGFKYCQTLTWCKKPKGTGQGGLYCPTTEFLLLARKGKMPVGKKRQDTTWWEVKRPMRHSKKPEFFQDLIELQSEAPRIELFARRERDGWDVWGNEV
ncbi:MT-A70 family methyltransferase, partial [uncultured Paraglaciecola sp.]|uniref:MT-A70 family methyltransferase n=1 Tax=uncultured Paraglaciecola sp. TaxID=1765024 RepID=UPI002631FF6C